MTGSVAGLLAVATAGAGLVGCDSSGGARPAAHAGRAADACTMLTSDEVSDIVGTPGPFTGASEDAAEDGSPVWGCTWGTPRSYADVREITAARYAQIPGYDDLAVTSLDGIGDRALLERDEEDGGNPAVAFLAGGHYYRVEIEVDRRELGTDHADFETKAEKSLAGKLAGALGS